MTKEYLKTLSKKELIDLALKLVDPDKLITQSGFSRRHKTTKSQVQYMIRNEELDTLKIRGGLTLIYEADYKKITIK